MPDRRADSSGSPVTSTFGNTMKKIATTVLLGLVLLCVADCVQQQAHDFIANLSFHLLQSKTSSLNPSTVRIEANGKQAVFHKHTASYDELLKILHNGHSPAAFAEAGVFPSSGDKKYVYGKIIVYNLWIPVSFRISRSNENKNYCWISVPHANGLGTHLPLFALGPRFDDLVDSASSNNSN